MLFHRFYGILLGRVTPQPADFDYSKSTFAEISTENEVFRNLAIEYPS